MPGITPAGQVTLSKLVLALLLSLLCVNVTAVLPSEPLLVDGRRPAAILFSAGWTRLNSEGLSTFSIPWVRVNCAHKRFRMHEVQNPRVLCHSSDL